MHDATRDQAAVQQSDAALFLGGGSSTPLMSAWCRARGLRRRIGVQAVIEDPYDIETLQLSIGFNFRNAIAVIMNCPNWQLGRECVRFSTRDNALPLLGD